MSQSNVRPKAATAAGSGGVEKNPRKTAKSRNGCQTCKVKRLKCDETRPACENCTKRGYDCPGYKKPLKWSTKYEVLQPDEPDSHKVFHPSVEFHFSSIDPTSFGQRDPCPEEEVPPPNGDHNGPQDASEQMIDSLVATYIPPPQFVPGLDAQGPYCAWTDSPTAYPNHDRAVALPFHGLNNLFVVAGKENENEVQAVHRKRTNSAEEIAQWKSLLRAYYQMCTPPMSRLLQNDSTALVQHYFREVCVLYSSFDSKLNPFRTVVGRLWDNSSSIFYAIQSMAAAHLANFSPNMSLMGLQMQRKAYECLQQELQLAHVNQNIDDKLLLTVLLLGMSSPWHDPGDLGMAHLNAARALIYPRLLHKDNPQTEDMTRNDQFFAEALIYWEMCVAFVLKEPLEPGLERPNNRTDYNEARPMGTKVMPHPWTGVCPRAQMIFAEVGRLVRSYRALIAPTSYGSASDNLDTADIVAAASCFEEELLAIRWPAMDDLVDVQDENTGKFDFIMVAEATRCAALLEIYCVFPGILHSRFGRVNGQSLANPLFFPYCNPPLEPKSNDTTAWLTSLARHIVLDLIGNIPIASGTRPLQLILLTTAAAELRLAGPITSSPLDVACVRKFAMARLQELASHLPSKPVFLIINLIREVWRRHDIGEEVFWLDVMHEKGWQTVMG